jgi:hypothetical protein
LSDIESVREKFYDEHIAPELLRLGKLCQDNGLSLIAMVEWEPGETGRTTCLAKGSGIAIRMADAAMQAHGNVDSLYFALAKHARDVGHNSIVLQQMGIPSSPEPTP